MRPYLIHLALVVALLIAAAFGFSVSPLFENSEPAEPERAALAEALETYLDPEQPKEAREQLDTEIDAALRIIQADAFDPPDPASLIEAALQGIEDLRPRSRGESAGRLRDAALNGMAHSLDSHSGFIAARTHQDAKAQAEGTFAGLGIEIATDHGQLKVVAPIDDSPALRAGLRPGDVISRIDGELVHGLDLNAALARLRGPLGSPVTLSIERPGQGPFEVALERAIVSPAVVRHRAEGRLGYIRVSAFNERTMDQLRAALADLQRRLGPTQQGLVMDLRRSPGGLMSEALAAADLFLESGQILALRSRNRGSDQVFRAKPGDAAGGLPIVVLIDGGTGGMSEIVARALQSQGRALLLGQPSFGKVSLQSLYPLRGAGALRITTARQVDPSGALLPAKGIEPDITVGPGAPSGVASGGGGPRSLSCPGAGTDEDPALACALAVFDSGQIERAIRQESLRH